MEDVSLDTVAMDLCPDKDLDTLQQGNLLTSLKDEASWPVDQNLLLWQRDPEDAYDVVTDLLNLPKGDDEERALCEVIDDANDKKYYDKWLKEAHSFRKHKVDIMQHDSVTNVAWIPANQNEVLNLLGSSKGTL